MIGAEKLSDITDWTDRSSCILFGDGAGAAVVGPVADGEQPGIGPVVWGSAPEKGDTLTIEGWRPYIVQEGQAVFRWATTALPRSARKACHAPASSRRELAAFVPHQANLRIIEAWRASSACRDERRRQRHRRVRQHLRRPAIPLAMSKLVERRGRSHPGRRSCSSASAAASPTPGRSSGP